VRLAQLLLQSGNCSLEAVDALLLLQGDAIVFRGGNGALRKCVTVTRWEGILIVTITITITIIITITITIIITIINLRSRHHDRNCCRRRRCR
jgi:hypothetical protein